MRNSLDAIEDMIDKNGLIELLEDIATICDLKAEHLREAWQDTVSAKTWERAATNIHRAAQTVTVTV